MNSLSGTGSSVLEELPVTRRPTRLVTRPSVALEADHLVAELPLAALIEGVGGERALRRKRPRRVGVTAVRRYLGVDVEQRCRQRALAVGVGDAVHAGVAAADDDDVLALGDDLLAGLGVARDVAAVASDEAVALVEVVHREVDAVELAAGRLEVALDPRADRDDHGVVGGGELSSVDVAADLGVVFELDALLLEQRHAPVDHPLLELCVRDAEAHQAAGRLVALVDGDLVADLVELLGGGETGRAGADHGDRCCRCAAGAGARRSSPPRSRGGRSRTRSA